MYKAAANFWGVGGGRRRAAGDALSNIHVCCVYLISKKIVLSIDDISEVYWFCLGRIMQDIHSGTRKTPVGRP